MTQVILNSVIKAADAMPEGGRLTIRTENVALHAPARPRELLPEPQARYPAERTRRFKSFYGEGISTMLLVRIELTTSPLPRGCSTTELQQRRCDS